MLKAEASSRRAMKRIFMQVTIHFHVSTIQSIGKALGFDGENSRRQFHPLVEPVSGWNNIFRFLGSGRIVRYKIASFDAPLFSHQHPSEKRSIGRILVGVGKGSKTTTHRNRGKFRVPIIHELLNRIREEPFRSEPQSHNRDA